MFDIARVYCIIDVQINHNLVGTEVIRPRRTNIPRLCRNGKAHYATSPVFYFVRTRAGPNKFLNLFCSERIFFMKTEFHTKHTKHYVVLIVLLVATAVSGFILFNDAYEDSPPPIDVTTIEIEEQSYENVYNTVHKKEPLPTNQNEKKSESIEQPIQNEPGDTTPPNTQIETLPKTSSEVSEEEETLIDATFIAPGISYKARIAENSNVYDLMSILRDAGIVSFTTKDFGGNLGLFVEQINGIKNGTDNKFWIYYINGKEAKTGISNYTLNNTDVIEWKYEESTF